MALSARKVDGTGFKNDCIGTTFPQCFVAVRHKERVRCNQLNTLKELLKETLVNCILNKRVLMTADQGCRKKALWGTLVKNNVDFSMIVNKFKNSVHQFWCSSEAQSR